MKILDVVFVNVITKEMKVKCKLAGSLTYTITIPLDMALFEQYVNPPDKRILLSMLEEGRWKTTTRSSIEDSKGPLRVSWSFYPTVNVWTDNDLIPLQSKHSTSILRSAKSLHDLLQEQTLAAEKVKAVHLLERFYG